MARAISSFSGPVSPSRGTVESPVATVSTSRSTRRSAALCPTIPWNAVSPQSAWPIRRIFTVLRDPLVKWGSCSRTRGKPSKLMQHSNRFSGCACAQTVYEPSVLFPSPSLLFPAQSTREYRGDNSRGGCRSLQSAAETLRHPDPPALRPSNPGPDGDHPVPDRKVVATRLDLLSRFGHSG